MLHVVYTELLERKRAADMIFDEISTVHSPVCLCFIDLGLLFVNGKILHHGS